MHIKDITCTSSASQKMGTKERKTIKHSQKAINFEWKTQQTDFLLVLQSRK